MARRKPAEPQRSLDSLRPEAHSGELTSSSMWSGVDPQLLLDCVVALTANGDALLVGVTGDGGAMTALVLSGDKRRRFYEHDADEMERLLADVREWAENA